MARTRGKPAATKPKAKRPRGRPPKIAEPNVVQALAAALQRGTTIAAACAASGLSEATYYRAMAEAEGADAPAHFREFREAVTRAQGQSELVLVSRIFDASEKDWRAASWILTHRWPDRWGIAAALEGMVEREVRRIAEEFGLSETEVKAEMDNIIQFERRSQ